MHDFRGAILASLKSFYSGQLNADALSKAGSLSRSGGSGEGGDRDSLDYQLALHPDLNPAHRVETRKVTDC
jgi:hypothetical protein